MKKIAIIAPDIELASLCRKITRQMKLDDIISIQVGLTYRGVALAKEEKEKGAEAIISRGGTSILIRKEALDIPIVDIEITAYDLLYSLNIARKLGNKIAVIGFENVIEAIQGIDKLLEDIITNISVSIYKVKTENEIGVIVNDITRQLGTDGLVFIGGHLIVEKAREHGCEAVVLKSAHESVYRAINEARLLINTIRTEKERTNQFKTILEYISDGVLAVNSQGQVTVYNRAAENIIGVDKRAVVGKSVKEVIQNTRMQYVVETGREEVGVLQEIGSTTIVTNRTPILVDGKVVGAVATFQNVTQLQQLEQQVRRKLSRRGLMARWTFNDIIGESSIIQRTIKRAVKFSQVDNTILILGETGSGKEMFAQSIHIESNRKNAPFVAINCAALPETLLEGELFGYSEGAFTGAVKGGKAGLFELAHGGTIFLDEIGEISKHLQALLLRVLQEKEVRRLGDDRVIPINVRVIAASNQNLGALVEEGIFRDDLYYRLNVLNLEIPPLRSRKEDIPLLATYFLDKFRQYSRHRMIFTPEALELLKKYNWPGNVRQLENVLERLFATAEQEIVDSPEVEIALEGEPKPTGKSNNKTPGKNIFWPEQMSQHLEIDDMDGDEGLLPRFEKEIILKVLASVNGKKQEAARILGISNTTLWRRLKSLGISI